jgi:hypothetical protein
MSPFYEYENAPGAHHESRVYVSQAFMFCVRNLMVDVIVVSERRFFHVPCLRLQAILSLVSTKNNFTTCNY